MILYGGGGSRQIARMLLPSILLFLAHCRPGEAPQIPPTGDADTGECRYLLAPPLDDGSTDPCLGTTIFQEVVPNQWSFEDPTAVYTVVVDQPSHACVSISNGDDAGGHRVWWGVVRVGGEDVIDRDSFNGSNVFARARIDLDAGSEEIQVVLYGPRDAFVTVTIRAVPLDVPATDLVEGNAGKLSMSLLQAAPTTFSPSDGGTDAGEFRFDNSSLLSARLVADLHGDLLSETNALWPGDTSAMFRRLQLAYSFQISDSNCEIVRIIDGTSFLRGLWTGPVTMHVSARWDGRDSDGNVVPHGLYYYRLSAVLKDQQHQHGHRTDKLDEITSLWRTIQIQRIINSISLSKSQVCSGESVQVHVNATDPDDPLSHVAVSINGTQFNPSWIQVNGELGPKQYVVAAWTRSGALDSRIIDIGILDCAATIKYPILRVTPNLFHLDTAISLSVTMATSPETVPATIGTSVTARISGQRSPL